MGLLFEPREEFYFCFDCKIMTTFSNFDEDHRIMLILKGLKLTF